MPRRCRLLPIGGAREGAEAEAGSKGTKGEQKTASSQPIISLVHNRIGCAMVRSTLSEVFRSLVAMYPSL